MKLRLTTDGAQFKPSDDDTSGDPQLVAISALQGLDIEPDGSNLDQKERVATDNRRHEQNPATTVSVLPEPDGNTASQSAAGEKVSNTNGPSCNQDAEKFTVRCACAANEDDGMMIQCCKCHNWQHAICFRILDESEVPLTHVCNACAEQSNGSLQPTDSSLRGMSDAEMQMTCLWRRTLMAGLELDEVTISKLSLRLGIKKSVAMSLIDRLQREGYLSCGPTTRGRSNRSAKILDKSKLTNDAMKKYFNIDPANEVHKITSQTSSVDFHEGRQKRRQSSDQQNVMEKQQQASESKVCPVANDYEFELSNTQEDFEQQQPRRKRMKTSVAQCRHHDPEQ